MKKILAGFAMTSLVLVFGCGKAAEKFSENAIERAIEKQSGGKADVHISGGKMTVNTKDGKAVYDGSGNATIPADFPKDVYVVKGAKILSLVTVPDGTMLSMDVAGSIAKIGESYSSEMKSQGWTEEMNMKNEGQVMLAFKKEKRTVSCMVAGTGDKSQVVLTVSQEAKSSE